MHRNDSNEQICFHALDRQIAAFEKGVYRLKIPAPRGLMRLGGRRTYHFTPEFFIQISGCTDFDFPYERLRLRPNEIAVIPTGLPHGEVAWAGKEPFLHLVIMFYPDSVSWHLGIANSQGRPIAQSPRIIQTAEARRMADYLTDLIEARHSRAPARKVVVRGLMLAFLASLRNLVSGSLPEAHPRESNKVVQCRHDVLRHIADPRLNVKTLAKRMGCSANYLSNRFRHETGITLISFIQEQRVLQARILLETSMFNVAETGRAVGYDDPGYFSRVFKHFTGQTPKRYQNRHRAG